MAEFLTPLGLAEVWSILALSCSFIGGMIMKIEKWKMKK